MSPNDDVEGQNQFSFASQNKPLRTYSHKKKDNRQLLPALKPSNFPSKDQGPRLRVFQIEHPDLTIERREQSLSVDACASRGSISNNLLEDRPLRSIENYMDEKDEITSRLTPPRPPDDSDSVQEYEVIEIEEDEEDESPRVPIRQALKQISRNVRPAPDLTRSIRRRPFLIFDKGHPNSYKKLKYNSYSTNANASPYHAGDGFSEREAKPSGMNRLTRNGKLSSFSFYLGELDLAQSEPPSKPKRKARRVVFDNSFLPLPNKKPRRRLSNKQGTTEQEVKQERCSPAPISDNGLAEGQLDQQVKNASEEQQKLRSCNGAQHETFIAGAKEPGSCETRISESPPWRYHHEGRAASSAPDCEAKLKKQNDCGFVISQDRKRPFRRVHSR